jgi:hypothetical protein
MMMPWFRCFIRGENFPGREDDPDQPVGFYATRFVAADNPDEAETAGLADLRTHPVLTSLRGYPLAGRARVFFQEIEEVPASGVPAEPPGLVFFPMDDTPPAG